MTCRWLAVISSKLTETVVISFYQAQKIRVSLLLVLFFSLPRFPRALLCWGVHSADKYLFHADNLSFRERLFWFKVSIGKPGGKLLPIHSLKWNQNDVFTACMVIIKGLASGFVYRSCALRHKPNINGFEKEENNGGRRRDCFSWLYFGNICRFSDIVSVSAFSFKQFFSA